MGGRKARKAFIYKPTHEQQQCSKIDSNNSSNNNINNKKNNKNNNSIVTKERILVESQDGTKVPMSLFYSHNKNKSNKQRQNKASQAILFGYGSYGESMNPSFDPTLRPYLDRGFVLAYAHTRGGGDLGNAWYHQGRLYQKPNAIQDYIACAQALIHQGYTEPNHLTFKAFSAGGVLVGAAANQQPNLVGCVVLTNGFVDVLKAMQQSSLYLTQHEYDEWGNPNDDPKAAATIASYCPVTNANNNDTRSNTTHRARFLLLGNYEDTQVPYWNALIYGKKIRQNSHSKDKVHVHIESHGGHQLQLHVSALEAAFIIGAKPCYYGLVVEE